MNRSGGRGPIYTFPMEFVIISIRPYPFQNPSLLFLKIHSVNSCKFTHSLFVSYFPQPVPFNLEREYKDYILLNY